MRTEERNQAVEKMESMQSMPSNKNKLTTSEISQSLHVLGYRWSNEAQCYYSTDFELPLLTDRKGEKLAERINRFIIHAK